LNSRNFYIKAPSGCKPDLHISHPGKLKVGFNGILAKIQPGNMLMNFKPSLRFILLITILLSASLACSAVTNIFFGETPETYTPGAPEPVDPQPEPTSGALTCPLVTDRILEAAARYDEADFSDVNRAEPEHLYLVTYSVSGDRISAPYYEEVPADLAGFQEDISGHKEIWNYFVTLIPPRNEARWPSIRLSPTARATSWPLWRRPCMTLPNGVSKWTSAIQTTSST
jgi:hypothetical protein